MTTPYQARATARYNAKKYEQISVRVPKGTRDRWKDEAAFVGESLAKFISQAVENRINEKRRV